MTAVASMILETTQVTLVNMNLVAESIGNKCDSFKNIIGRDIDFLLISVTKLGDSTS